MKNRIKVLLLFSGSYLIALTAVRIFTWLSNRLFDDMPDLVYIPTLGLFSGFVPLIIASELALETTDNHKLTKKIIAIPFLIYAIGTIVFGIVLIVSSVNIGIPIFEYYSETGELFFIDVEHHWTYFIPKGITMAICSISIMKS